LKKITNFTLFSFLSYVKRFRKYKKLAGAISRCQVCKTASFNGPESIYPVILRISLILKTIYLRVIWDIKHIPQYFHFWSLRFLLKLQAINFKTYLGANLQRRISTVICTHFKELNIFFLFQIYWANTILKYVKKII
jgi:hypothetical protein